MERVLSVKNLSVEFPNKKSKLTSVKVVNGVGFELYSGESLGIAGESGSGKSMLVSSIIKLLPRNAIFSADEVNFSGKDLVNISEKEMVKLRGRDISMIFQDPAASLSPTDSIGKQLSEVFILHEGLGRREADKKSIEMLEKVGINEPKLRMRQYPHELSGGMLQRVMIAMALACKPKLLIADEPTTALDVTTQKQILLLIKKLCEEIGTAAIIISHDLRIIAEVADRVIVMKDGIFVEEAEAKAIFDHPKADYTKLLISSMPDLTGFKEENAAKDESVLSVNKLKVLFGGRRGIFSKSEKILAVDGVSFEVYRGETLGLVGESGCGKSTLSRTLLKLIKRTSGDIIFENKDIDNFSKEEMKHFRKKVQLIFQNSYSSLNPRMTIAEILEASLKTAGIKKPELRTRVLTALSEVGLSEDFADRYPHELSGGQKQRIVIARALIGEPELVICDEPVSALDVSIQADILKLLEKLKKEKCLTYIFISHDLGVVKNISDRVMVMYKGKIIEENAVREIFENPKEDYTKALLASIPGYKGVIYELINMISGVSKTGKESKR